jgi:hypothetical protein
MSCAKKPLELTLFQNLQPVGSANQDLPMKFISTKRALPRGLGLLATLAALWVSVVYAQAQLPFAPPTNPMAQRNALNLLLNQVNWFENAARGASSYPSGGYGLLVQQFQAVRDRYNGFKSTLTPQQLASNTNQLAELDAGLDIIQEAFTNYQTAVANGQSSNPASANLRLALNKAIQVWTHKLKQYRRQLRVG